MIDLFGTDFCYYYKEYGRKEIDATSLSTLFNTSLDYTNVLKVLDYSFILITPGINGVETEMVDQTFDNILKYGMDICHQEIGKDYIEYQLNKSIFRFMAVKSGTSSGECQILAFRLLKPFETRGNIAYLYKYKIIQSVLLCALPVNKFSNISSDASEVVDNPSFGSYLTYQTVKWAIKVGYQFYVMRAADFKLLLMYRRWGFHFGLPFLNLDIIVDKVLDEDYANMLSNVALEKGVTYDEIVEEEIVREINNQLLEDWRKASIILDISKKEWEIKRKSGLAFSVESRNIFDNVIENKSLYMMYIDLYSKDVDVLREYSKKKMKNYFLEKGIK